MTRARAKARKGKGKSKGKGKAKSKGNGKGKAQEGQNNDKSNGKGKAKSKGWSVTKKRDKEIERGRRAVAERREKAARDMDEWIFRCESIAAAIALTGLRRVWGSSSSSSSLKNRGGGGGGGGGGAAAEETEGRSEKKAWISTPSPAPPIPSSFTLITIPPSQFLK